MKIKKLDKCQVCNGTRGGEPGNENRIDGLIVCDYCHANNAAEYISPSYKATTRAHNEKVWAYRPCRIPNCQHCAKARNFRPAIDVTLGSIRLAKDFTTPVMSFKIELPEGRMENIKSQKDRIALGLEILEAMEADTREYQDHVNSLRKDVGLPLHTFSYPWTKK